MGQIKAIISHHHPLEAQAQNWYSYCAISSLSLVSVLGHSLTCQSSDEHSFTPIKGGALCLGLLFSLYAYKKGRDYQNRLQAQRFKTLSTGND